jgi:hypothetical protein
MASQYIFPSPRSSDNVRRILLPQPGFAPVSRRSHSTENRASLERNAVVLMGERVNALGDLRHASFRTRRRVLAAVRAIVPAIDTPACPVSDDHYGRRVLWEDPSGWSLAAISLRYGQQTEAHDHSGWGGAVTVQGIERNHRFQADETGELQLIARRDYPAGTCYLFDPTDIHQPIGYDPLQFTVALHFLVHDRDPMQHEHEIHPSRPEHGNRSFREFDF